MIFLTIDPSKPEKRKQHAASIEVGEAVDLSPHLATSYQCLADITASKGDDHDGKYRELSYAYGQMVRAVNASELRWGLYLARK